MSEYDSENVYLNVCSRDSLIYFPDNKAADFRVKLAKPMHLKGCWKISLCEIWLYNISKGVEDNNNDSIRSGDDEVDVDVDGNSDTTSENAEGDDGNNGTVNLKDIGNVAINCSICMGLIVNGIQTRTLRKVPADENVYMVFPILYYVPVEKGFIDTIDFTINTSDGELLPFDALRGKVEMTLRLKRC
jgi:hypothetical protein